MLIQTEEQFRQALTVLLDADKIAVDTETYEIVRGVPTRLLGISTYCEIKGRPGMFVGMYFPFRHEHDQMLFPEHNLDEEYLRRLAPALQREDALYVFHNQKFDIAVLARDNITVPKNTRDTQIIAHMINENLMSKKLEALVREFLGKDLTPQQKRMRKLVKTLGGWHKIPPSAMALYSCEDTEFTYRLEKVLWDKLVEDEQHTLWDEENQFNRVIASIEQQGVAIHVPTAKRLAYESHCGMQEIQDALGFDPGSPATLARKLFGVPPEGLGLPPGPPGKNKLSPALQTSKGLIDRVPSMDARYLRSLNHPVAEHVIKYRGLQKAASTWFEGFLGHLHPDGRLHPEYRQDGTVTSRLSCANPNMQQIPREADPETSEEDILMKHKVKSMLRATEGYGLWEYDYSQIEYRLAACYGQDEALIEAYRSGSDMHQLTADLLALTRQQAKTLNFAILYGAGALKIGDMLGYEKVWDAKNKKWTCPEASDLLAEFWSAYPGLRHAALGAVKAAEARGWVRYWNGRKRHFKWPSEYHKAFNSVIQGGAAQIMKRSMIELHGNVRMVGQVHDSLWIEIPSGNETQRMLIRKTMEWPGKVFPVPFPVDEKELAGSYASST